MAHPEDATPSQDDLLTELQALKLTDPDIKIEPTDDDTWKWSPSSVSIRRANIDSHIWFEMLMLPPHAMAGSKYYACEVP
jgi:hypothetical protein